jgi:hypothetical protein
MRKLQAGGWRKSNRRPACRMRHPKTMKIEATADRSLACPLCDGAPRRSLRDDTGGMNTNFQGGSFVPFPVRCTQGSGSSG